MVSFQQMMEHMEVYREGQEETTDRKATEAIRAGINIREDFWDDFLLLLNSSSALSELLKISPTKVSAWRGRVQKYLERVHDEDDVPDLKKRASTLRAEKDPFNFDW